MTSNTNTVIDLHELCATPKPFHWVSCPHFHALLDGSTEPAALADALHWATHALGLAVLEDEPKLFWRRLMLKNAHEHHETWLLLLDHDTDPADLHREWDRAVGGLRGFYKYCK